MSLGPYIAKEDGRIEYTGNKIFKPMADIQNYKISKEALENRMNKIIHNQGMWKSLLRILNGVYISTVQYFEDMGAHHAFLPLTTRMISSPGALYGKDSIDYTQDTVPIKLQWFNYGTVFLSESSQLYLELMLVIPGINHVFSIYNSFRKEVADATHLSEFHHVEYEGRVTQQDNEKIAQNLTKHVVAYLLTNHKRDLQAFLTDDDIADLEKLTRNEGYTRITLKNALKILADETGKEKYNQLTSQYWGAWEETYIANRFDNVVIVAEFPMKEVAFYHKPLREEKDPVTGESTWVVDNADFIFPGYREYLGSGHRIETIDELEWKARIFNLPRADYEPYYQARAAPTYKPTSGFGMGLERFVHGILKLPTITYACPFPRTHATAKP